MLRESFVVFGIVLLQLSCQAQALDCDIMGISVSCPTALDDKSKAFCCTSSVINSVHYCCDIEDYIKENQGILAGIVVAAIVILLICTLCCCCFCSCCLLAKRRTHRGRVLYDPVNVGHDMSSTTVTSTSYVHPPPTQVHGPPPPSYYPPANPNIYQQSANPNAYQPPVNPNFKY